jgi:hypothetical protein
MEHPPFNIFPEEKVSGAASPQELPFLFDHLQGSLLKKIGDAGRDGGASENVLGRGHPEAVLSEK